MDAASPVCRWLLLTGLLAMAGCQSSGVSPPTSARGQAPLELPAPLSPASLTAASAAQPLPPQPPSSPLRDSSGSPLAAKSLSPRDPDAEQFVQGFPINQGPPPVQGFPVSTPSVTPASLVVPAPGHAVSSNDPKANDYFQNLVRESTAQVKLVALVGLSNPITEQEVQEQLQQDARELEGLPAGERKVKEREKYREVLGKLIERELIIDDMVSKLKKSKASFDDIKEDAGKMADEQIRSIRKQSGIRTEEEFIANLHAHGMTLSGFKRQIERRIMVDQYIFSLFKETGKSRTAGFSEIRAYYEQHLDEFQVQDRVRWQDLFVSINRFNSAADAMAHAQQLRQRIREGADFVSLVKEEEKSPIPRQNWDGIGTSRNDVPQDVAPAVWSLMPGQVSDIISTPVGYHIVKVVEREYAGPRPLDVSVQTIITEKLKKRYKDREYKKLIEDLWRNSTIQVFPNAMLTDSQS